MNFIDISSWQKGLDLSALFLNNQDLDGVIVKATQGTSYVNPEYAAWVKWLAGNGKPFGVYHYLGGGDASAEAQHFYNTVKPYINKCVPVADYEEEALAMGTVWLKRFLDRFRELSGVRCMIYCSLSVVQTQNFTALTEYPLWVAQYADMNPVYGFVESPWQKGSVAPFSKYWMHQYTGNGRLSGYWGALDLDKFYGTVADWNRLLGGGEVPVDPVEPDVPAKKVDASIVSSVLAGNFGIGGERVIKLKDAGYNPDEVQAKINELYAVAAKIKPIINPYWSYLASVLKILKTTR